MHCQHSLLECVVGGWLFTCNALLPVLICVLSLHNNIHGPTSDSSGIITLFIIKG